MLSPSSVASIAIEGATLSSVRVWLACAAGLPAKSDTSAWTVMEPLLSPLMSASAAVQTPPVTVAVVTTSGLTPSDSVTVTVWPFSTPEVVPETVTVLSSDALTMLSPSSVASIAIEGATLSSVRVWLACAAGLPAKSDTSAWP